MIAAHVDDLVVVVLDFFFPLRGHGFLHCRKNVIGRAMKHGDLGSVFGHGWHHLHRACTGTDDADPLAFIFKSLGPA